jgi:3-phosphoshikimate 1-carboxyvinyltransferase
MDEANGKTVYPHPRAVRATVEAPGDKSVSHRAAMLAALAGGTSIIRNFLVSEDCLNTLHAVETLGAAVRREGTDIKMVGVNGRFRVPARELDMGNSGTGMRLLAGLLAGHPFVSVMTGDASLRSRPMRRIREPLERMGCAVELLGPNQCAPIRIRGGALEGVWYDMPMASAQVKSCLLLAGLFARGRTTAIEPLPTRDHTEIMLRRLGATVEIDGARVTVEGSGGEPPALRGTTLTVPGDFSSAAFWMVAAAARPGSQLTLRHVGLNPRRTALLDVLRRMGAAIRVQARESEDAHGAEELQGDIEIRGAELEGTQVGGTEIPNLIDELPLIGVAGALARGTTSIRDAAELRVKESDRIATLAQGLARCGVSVAERADGLEIVGGSRPQGGATVDSGGDHRIAMAMAVLALFADRPVRIENVACVATSYPGFWDTLADIYAQNKEEA